MEGLKKGALTFAQIARACQREMWRAPRGSSSGKASYRAAVSPHAKSPATGHCGGFPLRHRDNFHRRSER